MDQKEWTRKRGGVRARYLKYLEYPLRGTEMLPGSKKMQCIGLLGRTEESFKAIWLNSTTDVIFSFLDSFILDFSILKNVQIP